MKLKFSISKKLMLGFAVPVVTLLIFGIVISTQINKNIKTVTEITTVSVPSVKFINKYYTAINESHYLLIEWVYSGSGKADGKSELNSIQDSLIQDIERDITKLQANWPETDIASFKAIKKAVKDSLFVAQKEVMNALNSSEAYGDWATFSPNESRVAKGGDIDKLTHSILHRTEKILSKFEMKSTGQTDQILKRFDGMFFKVLIASVLLIALTLLASFFTSRNITRPIAKMHRVLKRISKGDIPNTQLKDRGDEVGQMALAVNDIITELRKIVSGIKLSSEELSTMGTHISKQSENLMSGAENQAEAVESVTISLAQIKDGINETKKNANNAEDIVSDSVSKISENNINVKHTVDALQKISERITIISDLAFQTNILSLNAAIEASRAGKYGKGFSVVATEVGNLAERSQASSDDIDELSSSSIKTAKITELTSAELVPEIQEAERLVQLVKNTSLTLNRDLSRIEKAISELNFATQNSSLFAFEMTSLSEDLGGASKKLIEAVSFFKVDGAVLADISGSEEQINTIKLNETSSSESLDSSVQTVDITQKFKQEPGVKIDLGDIPDDDFEVF